MAIGRLGLLIDYQEGEGDVPVRIGCVGEMKSDGTALCLDADLEDAVSERPDFLREGAALGLAAHGRR